MKGYAVIKGASYTLAVTPDMVIHNGTTQTTEMIVNPGSEYLKELPNHLRSFEEAVSYMPNQVYIGNETPQALSDAGFPWYDKLMQGAVKDGKYGEIMPEDEFYGLIQICDVFDLVKLEKDFAADVKAKLDAHHLFTKEQVEVLDKNAGTTGEELAALVKDEHGEPLYYNHGLVGVVKRAHDVDVNLSAHVMLENLATKASNVLSLLNLVKRTGVDPSDIDYVVDCCEEACGDMNQRGGGNFAKAAAETAGLVNATGSDVRGFCAGPAHAMLHGAALVKAGTFKNVVVTAGGCTAKLGMNGKDHVKKGLPILEDAIAGFSVLISADDGVSPQIRTDIVGRHTVGTGSAPQNVISSLVTVPLDKAGLKLADIDKYSPEMQNPDITKPAGAGDVPESNYKMIAALGVKRGELQRSQIGDFVKKHGMTGWAPTQGHIPSGVPYLGFLRDEILGGKTKRAMIIGKGSLFLGRLTNLFDGVSFVVQANDGSSAPGGSTDQDKVKAVAANTFPHAAHAPETGRMDRMPVIGFASEGSEHGRDNIEKAMKLAGMKGLRAVLVEGDCLHKKMEHMLDSGEIGGAVTMHYPFPIGVSTVGKVITPGTGSPMYIAATTGTSDTDRVIGMIKNAIYGIIAAKADGVENPAVGIINIDGARQAEKALLKLAENGYDIHFADSVRADGGIVMRGNDLLGGTPDIMVMDSLTGNLMMKVFSSYTTGGNYESLGFGYGPGIGEDYDRLVMIVSRASGAPVIAGAMEYAASLIRHDWKRIAREEFEKADQAGLKDIIRELKSAGREDGAASDIEVEMPSKEVVTSQIPGIEVMDLEDAVKALWKAGIYAESGMGCTGPIVLMADDKKEKAYGILKEAGYVS